VGDSEIWRRAVVGVCGDKARRELILRESNGLTGACVEDVLRWDVSPWGEGFNAILGIDTLALEDFDVGRMGVANFEEHFSSLRSRFCCRLFLLLTAFSLHLIQRSKIPFAQSKKTSYGVSPCLWTMSLYLLSRIVLQLLLSTTLMMNAW